MDDELINPEVNANEEFLEPGNLDNNIEQDITPYPKSNENNSDFINRIMNSKSFQPGSEEETKFLEDTHIEIAGLKTLGLLLYIFKRRSGA